MKNFQVTRLFFGFIAVICFFYNASASEPAIWSVNTRAEVLQGDARGVSINENGTITLAPKLSEIFNTEQSYVWSSAADASGNVFLGTGGDGKIFRVDANGRGTLFYDTNELNVAAIAVGTSGEIYAGTAPDGKVYRIESNGTASVFFNPKEKYIWSLAVLNDGVAVGTGENGKIYLVKSAGAAPESSLLFDTSETHIISLAADRQGNLYAGTDASGLVLKFGSDGKPFALLDSPLREIHDLSIAADGSVYALALGESASTAKPADGAATSATPEGATVSVEKANPLVPETPARSRYDLTGAKSAVYRILPDGGNDILWNSANVTGFSVNVNPNGNGVFLGTSDKGRIYGIGNDGRETLILQSDESQISTLTATGQNFYATSSNQGKLFRFGAETIAEGNYESPVLDAKSVAAWGRIWWRSGGNVQIQTRSGNTEKPNETWSAWSAALTDGKGAQIASPSAKYMQWRAILRGSGNASLSEVNVSFLGRNIAPEVLSIQILPPSVGLAANPPVQIDPNIELSGLDPQIFGIPNVVVAPRRIYQRAATSLQWTAEDRNGDRLEYDVFYREANESNFKLLRDNLTDNFLTIDGQTLADGRYIFRIRADDRLSNPEKLALSGERTSEPVDIDNTAPSILSIGAPQINGERARIVFEATDASSFLNRAEYSVNGGEWQTVYADDGISDSPRERFTIEIPLQTTGEHIVTLRVFDANGNAGNSRALIRR